MMAICMTDPFWSPAVGGRRGLLAFGDAIGEVGGVVLDEAEQRRAAGVLPRQAEEVQAGHVGDAAPVDHAAAGDHAGDVDPGVVGPEARGPDDRADLKGAAVGVPGRAPLAVLQPGPEPDPGPLQPAPAGPG